MNKSKMKPFYQEYYFSVIFPFRYKSYDTISDSEDIKKYETIHEKIKTDGHLVSWEEFITNNSRHFDYIESIISNHDGHAYHFMDSHLKNNEKSLKREALLNIIHDKLVSLHPNMLNTESTLYQTHVEFQKYHKEDVRLISFRNGIFFFSIDLKILHVRSVDDYFMKTIALRDYIKTLDILNFCSYMTGLSSDDIQFFDMKNMDETHYTTRFLSYVNINFIHGNRPTQKDIESISKWIINRNSVQNNKRETISHTPYSMFLDNQIYSSEEGFISTTIENQNNKNLIHNTKKWMNQNAFFSYMLVLNQLYYLHMLKHKLQEIDIYCSKTYETDLIKIIRSYAFFKAKFLYNKVSQFFHQQKLYEHIQSQLGIMSFIDEFDKAVTPIHAIVDYDVQKKQLDQEKVNTEHNKKIEKKLNIFFGFSIFSGAVTVISYLTSKFVSNEVLDILLVFLISLGLGAISYLIIKNRK